MFIIGAIGSIIDITRDSVWQMLEGNRLTDKPKRSLAWYMFLPIFGGSVAFAVLSLFKAGQLAVGNGRIVKGHQDSNMPILSVVALFAGLMSWQALKLIGSRGDTLFRTQECQFRRSSGLENQMCGGDHSLDALATSIGRAVDQVFHWLFFRDRVSSKIRDRLVDRLDVSLTELFRVERPQLKKLSLRVSSADDRGSSRETFGDKLGCEHVGPEKLEA